MGCNCVDYIRCLRIGPSQYSDKAPDSTKDEEGKERKKNVSFQTKNFVTLN